MTTGGEWFMSGVMRLIGGLISVGILAFVIGYCGAMGVFHALN